MNEKLELYKHIYKDAEMSCYTLKKLEKDLKEKDNKIKSILEDIKKGYESYKKKSKELIKKNKGIIEKNSLMGKVMAGMSIKKEVISDNSDSSMSDLLIQGISMGTINMEKKIKDYENIVDSEELNFAKEFLSFQTNMIEKLKEYL